MLLHSFHSDCNVLSINLSSDFLITINFSSLQLLSFFLSDLQELEGSSPGLLFPFLLGHCGGRRNDEKYGFETEEKTL